MAKTGWKKRKTGTIRQRGKAFKAKSGKSKGAKKTEGYDPKKATRRFPLGKLVWSRGVNDRVADNTEFAKFALQSLRRHANGDWGDMSAGDKKENDYSVNRHLRIFSAYEKEGQPKIWIITEADRSATTILYPSEY